MAREVVARVTPEEEARQQIDRQLGRCGWIVQDDSQMNISAGPVAIREFPLTTGHADYMLYVDGKAIGVVEAKPEGHTLTGVETQSAKYLKGLPRGFPAHHLPLPFAYESTGAVTTVHERNGRFFDEEVAKLERWSDDLKLGLEREIKDLDQQVKEIRRETQAATALTEKLAAQKKLKTVESERNRKRRELYDAQDAIDRDRDELIAKIEKQLSMEQKAQSLYSIRWTLL
ncbi:MAG: hypothetical protein HQ582_00795 [Planctomycetes bacterium]|nr:hypothetical protein [Planctomycetota bacterium]